MQTITTNLPSLNAQTLSERSRVLLESSMQKLSSGNRIGSAKDDAAGLAISERLTAGVTGLNRAVRNANDGVSLLQTADAAIGKVVDNFQRIRELAVQAANGTWSQSDREAFQVEANQLVVANQQIVSTTRFNGNLLLDGSYSDQLQVGAVANDTINIAIPEVLKKPIEHLALVDTAVTQATTTGHVSAALGAGDLTINGHAVGASVAGAGLARTAGSAYAVAAAINAAAILNVSASAQTSTSGTAGASANLANGALTINGISIGAITGNSAAAVAASAATAITAAAGSSGVTASANNGVLTLTAADGSDIIIGESVGGAAAALGLATGTTHGSVTVTDGPVVGNSSLSIGGTNPGKAGLTAGSVAGVATGATGQALRLVGAFGEDPIDLTTAAGAAAAIDYMDTKIDATNQIRAGIGASQARLALVIDRTEGAASDLDAARSRIRDADFAQETATLTRAQILQQAANAILTQANSQPRQALVLLR